MYELKVQQPKDKNEWIKTIGYVNNVYNFSDVDYTSEKLRCFPANTH